jgi:putative tricarboxylic transport membrane protein
MIALNQDNQGGPKMQWANQASSFLLIVFAIFVGVISIQLGIGGIDLMGSGFMPGIASVLLFVLSVIDFISSLTKGRIKKGDKPPPTLGELAKPAMLIAALILYVYFLKSVGFPIMTFLLVYLLFVMMQPKKWRLDLFFAALASALTFLLFDVVLKVSLPAGTLISWMR